MWRLRDEGIHEGTEPGSTGPRQWSTWGECLCRGEVGVTYLEVWSPLLTSSISLLMHTRCFVCSVPCSVGDPVPHPSEGNMLIGETKSRSLKVS